MVTIKDGVATLLDACLEVKAGEKVLYLYDDKHSSMAPRFKEACIERHLCFEPYEIENPHETPGRVVILTEFDYNIGVFNLTKSVWHTEQRKAAKAKSKRLVEIIADDSNFDEPVCCVKPNNEKVKAIINRTRPKIKEGDNFCITAPGGTRVWGVILTTPFFEGGDYKDEGGDFPFGEIGFSPKPGSVFGTVVFDLKIQHVGFTDKDILSVAISENRIVKAEGRLSEEYLSVIEEYEAHNSRYITEVAFGINPDAAQSVSDVNHIIEEKILGTAHFGHGARGRGGWFHFDGVIKDPTIKIGDCVIMQP